MARVDDSRRPLRSIRSRFHTTFRVLGLAFGALCLAPAPNAQKQGQIPTQDPAIKKVIEAIRRLEKAHTGLTMRLETFGAYASGREYRTRGQMRVLGTTHFHVKLESTFGIAQEIRSEVERVITPTGVWSRQQGPVESVFTRIDAELVKRLEQAQTELAKAEKLKPNASVAVPAYLSAGGKAPLGSSLVEALDRKFKLEVAPKKQALRDQQCTVLRGKWRGLEDGQAAGADRLDPDRVEVFLRPDGIPIETRQYDRANKLLLRMSITELKLGVALKPEGFVLQVPEGTEFMDVMDHRPSRAQIELVLGEYRALLEDRKKAAEKKDASPQNGETQPGKKQPGKKQPEKKQPGGKDAAKPGTKKD